MRTSLVVAAIITMAFGAGFACGGDDDSGATCGDMYCDPASETCTTCAADCGECGACTVSATCAASEVCTAGFCESAWSRGYRVTVVDGDFPDRMPSGDVWDTGGSVADCYVIVNIDGTTRISTAYYDDTTTPVWNESFNADIYSSSTIQWWVYDDDYGTDDLVFYSGDTSEPVLVNWLHNGSVDFTSSDGTYRLTLRFDPR